ncbi:hypothetical protein CcaverHIS002_0111630 [Cutaneotrichosporon cavernicola]|uniref:Uncharacterized protein n=1 Tax=Cutaneotrichosporon cavernicola TaxID=279322 RepID=A0AA48I5X3_9TREE|nr:uncharacterized protein CcaverHIS019_0111530 [Cutaneotrichosporon cavernicola]BEI80634.1 hypothetical protein CcaverHIS002_0111630 [Cutaneotrichosporon cavernicola]BEI88435.1 hypothetical protein CcaverHIS019_0111530 [Cutaneotrichosporon cavernicola]BEI96208.1 hypothetical protein CcaverHIS631_0111570 [Cutaneotrichosporon cavernicola]BEJ03979.1 hypothetical protein CcaverHIS641_0111540 [Cutaneotrichosporon cavernicola]
MSLRSHLRNLFQRSKRKPSTAQAHPRPLSTSTTSTTLTTSTVSSATTAFLGDSPSSSTNLNMADDVPNHNPAPAPAAPICDPRSEVGEARAAVEVARKSADESRATAEVARLAADEASKRREEAAAWRHTASETETKIEIKAE